MSLAVLQRRLNVGMAAAALVSFAAGAGFRFPGVIPALALLALALVWQPGERVRTVLERAVPAVALALLGWVTYTALLTGGDFLIPVLALLLFLLVAEAFRESGTRGEVRFFLLAFILLVASTAYYPGPLFAAAFSAYIAAATLALMVGHLRRQTARYGGAEVRVGRPFLVTTAALSAITVVMSAVVFLAFPRLQRQWIGVARASTSGPMIGFGAGVSLGEFGGRLSSNPEIVFRVEFPGGAPPNADGLHWKGRTYDRFDGVRWTRTPGLPTAPAPPPLAAGWDAQSLRYRIFGGPPGVDVLFGPHPVLAMEARSAMRIRQDAAGDLRFRGSDSPSYEGISLVGAPSAERLRMAPDGEDGLVPRHYLQLPVVSSRLHALADSLTRGGATRYERVVAVERWLHEEFRYTLDLPASRSEASLEHFLFQRRAGHCEYFSTAMVVLLRAAGIPARNVTGFLGGEWSPSGGYLAVTQNQAHSWVEAWFPGLGWVPFDPTPPGGAQPVGGAGAATSWAWPLRFWIDGLEHRWFKWVVFYDLQKQIDLFARLSEPFRRDAPGSARPEGDGGTRSVPWVLLALAAAAVVVVVRRGGSAPLPPESRLYLSLRTLYRRTAHGDAALPPLAWAERLEASEAPGAEPAARLVRSYLRSRFGPQPAGPETLAEMRLALREARLALRRGGREGGRPDRKSTRRRRTPAGAAR